MDRRREASETEAARDVETSDGDRTRGKTGRDFNIERDS